MRKNSCDCNTIHEDAQKTALESMLTQEETESLSALFKVMGDETRIRVLSLLESGELCVCDIAGALDMTKSAVSHQMAVLKSHGLVKSRREGKEVFYSLDDEHVSAIYALGLTHIKHKTMEKH